MRTIRGTKVTNAQADVYTVIEEFGPLPDHALVPLAQHAMGIRQSSSGIRTRRHELAELGLLTLSPKVWLTASNRKAHGWVAA